MSEITHHWDTWFQYQELQDIANVGLNTIRIQIGWAYEYLKSAVRWAASLNLKNGFDNSGLLGTRNWFSNDTNISRTLTALQILTAEFTQSFYNNSVIAIELINEPFPYDNNELNVLKSFYQAAYTSVRDASTQNSNLVVAIDEGFQGLQTWDSFMTEPYYHDVAMDTANLDWYCGQTGYLQTSNGVHWTIVGEFTRRGARYDNTLNGSAPRKTGADPGRFSADYVEYLAQSFETQTWVYEQAVKIEINTGADLSGWVPTPIYAKPHG
ncbi:hypothetical protein CI109_106600 [Kwoniella shandongensis]|uniref:Glycoside hydrolase family 5 domain-containing protein n=1 Tax=Kwoniella shandongensis TaxID=1734106 RepID=A0AAJ8LP40_9TREE